MWVNSEMNLDCLLKVPKYRFPSFRPGSGSGMTADPGSSPGGIQSFQAVADHLDSGFHRNDDFLRDHQPLLKNFATISRFWYFDMLNTDFP